MCAWVNRWLDTEATAPLRAREALKELDAASGLSVWAHWDDAGHAALLDALAKARAGERRAMEALSQGLGCGQGSR
jgi:hypothetical protein